ncbi:MAG: hypothetical protein ACI89L_002238 [Phycisphaerales bacterium]|jgi:hypothetical protein
MVCPLIALLLLAPPQSAMTADAATPTASFSVAADTWGFTNAPAFTSDTASFVLRDSPKDTLTAALAVGTGNTLSLGSFDGSTWASPTVLSTDVGGATSMTSDAAFEPSSGKLLIAYRKGSSALVYFRVFDPAGPPSLSGETWFDLGLISPPDRVLLAPKPGSNDILLVATSGTSARAAVWDSTAFVNSTTLDTGFDGDPEAISAEWHKGSAFVLWARSTDSAPRGSVFDGSAWAAATGLPALADPITRVHLAPSNDRASSAVLLTMASVSGVNHALHAATLDDTGWTAATTLSTQLATPDSYSAAWETSGTAAVAVWQEAGETFAHAARWDGAAWVAQSNTADLGGTIEGLVARPAAGNADGVHAMAAVSVASPRLKDYLLYANTGSLSLGMSTTVNGLSGAGKGFTLPAPPAGSPGATPVTVAKNKTVALAPGEYGAVSIANNSTLELSTGSYVLASMSPGNNRFTLTADTTTGPVILAIASGNFDAKNKLTISTVGPGPFEIHVLAGDFIGMNTPVINASVIVPLGDIDLRNNATTTAHLIASGNVSIGNSSTLDPPAWDSPFVDPSPSASTTTGLIVVTTLAGTPGTPITLLSGWTQPHGLPFDMSWQRPTAGVRVTSWREVPSYASP